MIHTINGNNFHGDFLVTVRGPAAGFLLSAKQYKKITDVLCGCKSCQCGGGYGQGPDADSATIEHVGYDKVALIPAALKKAIA
jgi:hypothetical protein